VAHQFTYDAYGSGWNGPVYNRVQFIDVETGEQNPLPTLRITCNKNPLNYRGEAKLTATLRDVEWSGGNKYVKLTPNGQTATIESLKNFVKTGSASIQATVGNQTVTYNVKVTPTFMDWLMIILLFGWIWA